MRSSEGRVLETADAFLDDKADRLWRTRSAALRELAQKVRDGTDLVLLCAGRIESCHGDLLKKEILAEAAQLEATSKRKPRSDKGKPRGPRGPRADSVETAARMGVLSTFYLRHAYGRDSPRLHEESTWGPRNSLPPSEGRTEASRAPLFPSHSGHSSDRWSSDPGDAPRA